MHRIQKTCKPQQPEHLLQAAATELQRRRNNDDDDVMTLLLPSHYQKELDKEARRQRMVPVLAMKTPMYDNIQTIDPDGATLSRISLKKARWYVNKQLARWVEEDETNHHYTNEDDDDDDGPQEHDKRNLKKNTATDTTTSTTRHSAHRPNDNRTLQLLFYPKNRQRTTPFLDERMDGKVNCNGSNKMEAQSKLDPMEPAMENDSNDTPDDTGQIFEQAWKRNVCVICGHDQNYRRYYVVPSCYRNRFPPAFKSHMAHDVVILCPPCHAIAEASSQERMRCIERDLRKQYEFRIRAGKIAIKSSEAKDAGMLSSGFSLDTSQYAILDHDAHRVKSAALALTKRKDQLPLNRIQHYQNLIRDYFQMHDPIHCDSNNHHNKNDLIPISDEVLAKAMELEGRIVNP